MRRRSRSALSFGCLALLATGCGPPAAERPRAVILLTCDTLRADRLGLHGWTGGISPSLDALAEQSLVFESAWSTAPLTGPALSALMTGKTPKEVGLKDNRNLLSSASTTLAEALARQGYDCAAIVSNWVLRKRAELPDAGVHQGFAHFDDDMRSIEQNRPDLRERVAKETTDAALRWLEERDPERPFFLWVHYQDPHGPYTPPAECLEPPEAAARGERPLAVGPDQRGYGSLPLYQVLGEERDPAVYRQRYEAEIRYFDRELGRLLEHLREGGLLEQALVVFTADHGESLGEHGFYFSHGQSLYRELVRVPLLIRRPGPAAGERVRAPASHLDLWPTILSACGVPPGDAWGVDLLAEARPEDRALPQFLSRQWSLTTARHRLIWADGRARLFDVELDPGEENDLAEREVEVVRELTRAHEAMLERIRPAMQRAAEPASSEQAQRELEALGYGGEDDDEH